MATETFLERFCITSGLATLTVNVGTVTAKLNGKVIYESNYAVGDYDHKLEQTTLGYRALVLAMQGDKDAK